MNYYNEFDNHAAAWLKQLIAEGLIPPGEVDQRSITDVSPNDLSGFTQCHFFAGIGGWALALEIAGWPDDRPVWTGSCPCQPFSVAGKQMGRSDPRHLWPAFRRLINRCRPPVVIGEQVASTDGRKWLSGVFANLETMGYAPAGSDLCAAGVASPHMRQRLYWAGFSLADRNRSSGPQHEHEPGNGSQRAAGPHDSAVSRGIGSVADSGYKSAGRAPRSSEEESRRALRESPGCGHSGFGLAYGIRPRLEGHDRDGDDRNESRRIDPGPVRSAAASGGSVLALGHAPSDEQQRDRESGEGDGWAGAPRGPGSRRPAMEHTDRDGCDSGVITSPTTGYGDPADAANFWADSRLILCRDGKHRRIPVEPALFPLADGLSYKLARRRSARAPLLRGAGNAIVPQVAAAFIRAFMEISDQ